MRIFCLLKRIYLSIIICLCSIFFSIPGFAWSIHPLLMKPGLSEIPEVKNAKPVQAKSLKKFLLAVEKDLEEVLKKDEIWLQKNLDWYQSLPEALAFKATGSPDTILKRFAHAIRINPDVKLGLYLQRFPGDPVDESKIIPIGEVTFLHDIEFWYAITFVGLEEGETVSALDVAASATDDPDFGLDVGLYENNNTEFGKIYGFGEQPFGNPKLEYGSQAPIHMGFYHESRILYIAADFIQQTYPEYRIRQYQTLARLAFQKGEDYWGWRFLGWGLHYLIDLQQPYHSTVLPGVSTTKMMWMNVKAMAGFDKDSNHAVQLVSNRHSVFERFQQEELTAAYAQKNWEHPVFKTLKQVHSAPEYNHLFPRDVVSKEAHDLAVQTEEIVVQWVPERFVSDPTFEFGDFKQQEEIVSIIRKEKGAEAVNALNEILSLALKNLPTYSRSYIRSVLNAN